MEIDRVPYNPITVFNKTLQFIHLIGKKVPLNSSGKERLRSKLSSIEIKHFSIILYQNTSIFRCSRNKRRLTFHKKCTISRKSHNRRIVPSKRERT